MSRYQIRIPSDSSEPPDHVVLPYISDEPKILLQPSENHPSPQSNQASHDGKTIAGLHKELQILSKDRLGTELFKRLNSVDGPSFHHYSNNPPATVLDLDWGEGHWILDAAVAWKGYGTKITDFDMEDDYDIEEEAFDIATLNGRLRGPIIFTDGPSHSVSSSLVPAEFYADPWTDQASAARELESLFEHVQNTKYGIHLCPSQFVMEMLQEIFGHSREVRTMHLTLASPDPVPQKGRPPDDIHQLTHAPGLMLWFSTLIPLPRTEIEIHALKHPNVFLSLKVALTSYAVEIAEEDEVDEEVVKESLWDYEGYTSYL
ncbi:hypothetical protein EDD18DRAFT_1410541 [Armillaria luteobubalina]|uniref:Methyltransferase domain-containing protein n=1 Tax=Armillaria luteobubalina TaxID=153913 RepID=A0AA39NUI6_9AGAR|nr:hypothetical protein EDD18DRAFT_1410541 [Armillaria luteobubalina]